MSGGGWAFCGMCVISNPLTMNEWNSTIIERYGFLRCLNIDHQIEGSKYINL